MKALLVVALLLSTAIALASSLDPQQQLEQGRQAYSRHDYKEAEQAVYPLLYPEPELGSEDAVVEARRLLALSYFFQKKMPEARKEVVSLLQLRPNYQLNAFVEAPVAVSFFENIRKEQEDRLRDIKRRQEEEAERARRDEERRRVEERARAQRVYVERTVEHHSRAIAMLPFGIGQAQNGDRGLAWMFGTTEATFAALSLGSWIAIMEKFPASTFQPADKQLAQTLLGLQIGAGAAFWAMAVAGIIDAQVKLKPLVVHERELPAGPKKTSWQLRPILSPGLYGLGAQGAF